MVMTATLPPPPPPPPPAMEEEPSSQQPTFLAQWLEKEKHKSPPETKRDYSEYYANQCLFPIHIPETAMCDVTPILSLLSRLGESDDGGIDSSDAKVSNNGISSSSTSQEKKSTNIMSNNENMTPAHRSALDDMRKIASLCATYKDRAVLNRDEYHYKRAKLIKEQQLLQEQQNATATDTDNNVKSDKSAANASNTPSPPPHHPEYTPLPLAGNFLLANIHGMNYNTCLANATCPDRTRRLLTCWESADPQWVKRMEQHGMEGYVCLEEREAVERCVGRSVQRVMKDVLG
mmetsp:Transcript_40608/g.74242  ORF Transcript_40608/g.74242 Transcript_40608/m.74242 type:complete len:290 (-) Transcript_40608:102-971(-)